MSFTATQTPPKRGGARVPLAWLLAIALVASAALAIFAVATLTPSGSGSGPLTVVDDLGRTVHLQPDPARVVVLGPNIMDIMFRLGLSSHVVGVDCYNGTTLGALESDYTPSQIALWGLSASMCVEASPFLATTLVNLTPDVVLASTIVSLAPLEQTTDLLGIPVIVLQPATLSGILLDDLVVGEIFSEGSAVASLNAALGSELYNATSATASAASLPTALVTYYVDASGYSTFGPSSFGQSLVEFAGAIGVGANASTPYPVISAAQVLAAQPQWIVYATGFGLGLSTYEAGPDWSSFTAVQHGNVTGIDSTLLTEPDPTMILVGLPALLADFHPTGA